AAARGLALLALFVSLQALDQYPHFVVLTLAVGAALYAWLWPSRVRALARIPLMSLWPVALIAIVTAFQLLLVRTAIADYQPSLRAHLVVQAREFDETGFVQASALIGSFLPMGFLAEFDALGNVLLVRIPEHWWLRPLRIFPGVSRAFIFRLDLLLFHLGFVPTVLAAVFAIRRGERRPRAWWFAFAGVLFLVSLQHSGLYLLILHLPLFNVFRSYFLYVIIVVFALLVIGAYGMDAYLRETPGERRRLLHTSLGAVLFAAAASAAALAWLVTGVGSAVALRTLRYLAFDGLLIAAGAGVVAYAGRARTVERGAMALIMMVALSGAVFVAAVAGMVGISRGALVARYELDDADRAPRTVTGWRDPATFTRKECHVYAQCYASQRDTVSLRRDLEGTFLRHRNEAVFQDGLAPPIVRALSALTHPVVWLSRSVTTYTTPAELTERLNRHAEDIARHLADTVYVSADAATTLRAVGNASGAEGERAVTAVRPDQDSLRVRYRAAAPAFLNAAVSYDRSWRATVNRATVAVVRGNFNGLVVAVPAGEGEVVLSYRSPAADAFFYTRYGALMAGAVVMAWLATDRRRRPDVEPRAAA
ncbi:MAG TPA: hypothetical protein VGL09_19185, partial [Methylomirabilota bacterium]